MATGTAETAFRRALTLPLLSLPCVPAAVRMVYSGDRFSRSARSIAAIAVFARSLTGI
jgi:hypothetical protein